MKWIEILTIDILKRLCKKYDIDFESFDVYVGSRQFKNKRSVKGFFSRKNNLIAINEKSMVNFSDVEYTVSHEFRHLWQYRNFPEWFVYWTSWRTDMQKKIGESAYLLAPQEIDANRFERSHCKFDDYFVIEATSIVPESPFEGIALAQDVVLKLINQQASLVNPDTYMYLVEHGLL